MGCEESYSSDPENALGEGGVYGDGNIEVW